MMASARIEEIAEEKRIPENEVGAVLLLWRQEACDLLDGQPRLLDETLAAIENECLKEVVLPRGDESTYVSRARQPVLDRDADVVAFAWAEPPKNGLPLQHITIATKGGQALRIVSPGFGRKGEAATSCIRNPWPRGATKSVGGEVESGRDG